MSKNNGFRLQPVLNFKSSMVSSLETEFAYLKQIHKSELSTLQQLETTVITQRNLLTIQQQEKELNCQTIDSYQRYLQTLEHNVLQQRVKVESARAEAEYKREELVKTMQDQKTLENLKERHLTIQARENNRKEAKIVDDLVITRYARKGYTHA